MIVFEKFSHGIFQFFALLLSQQHFLALSIFTLTLYFQTDIWSPFFYGDFLWMHRILMTQNTWWKTWQFSQTLWLWMHVRVIANEHAFGASLFHVLRLCSGIKKLTLDLSPPSLEVIVIPLIYIIFICISWFTKSWSASAHRCWLHAYNLCCRVSLVTICLTLLCIEFWMNSNASWVANMCYFFIFCDPLWNRW